MAALASLGALALLLLSGLSCCSGSGLAGARFWRASHPRLVVRGGRRGAGEAGVWAFFFREAGGLWSRQPSPPRALASHTFTKQLGCWEKQPSLSLVYFREEESQSLSRAPGPSSSRKNDTRPCCHSRSSRSRRGVGQEQSSAAPGDRSEKLGRWRGAT